MSSQGRELYFEGGQERDSREVEDRFWERDKAAVDKSWRRELEA